MEGLIHLEEKVGGFVVGVELEDFLFFECEVKFGFDEMEFLLEEGLILVMVVIRVWAIILSIFFGILLGFIRPEFNKGVQLGQEGFSHIMIIVVGVIRLK